MWHVPMWYVACVRLHVIEIETYACLNCFYLDLRQFSELILGVPLCAHWFIQNLSFLFSFSFVSNNSTQTLSWHHVLWDFFVHYFNNFLYTHAFFQGHGLMQSMPECFSQALCLNHNTKNHTLQTKLCSVLLCINRK